ncbi:MAG: transposase [Cellvibrio sp.]|nr:transposase [Cellvibrio sp.]
MRFNPEIHHRKSIRLKNYDYSALGFYFITICCHQQLPLLGKIRNGLMHNNDIGNLVVQCWLAIAKQYSHIKLHEYVVMPNHFHGIIEIGGFDQGAINCAPTIGNIVRGFKGRSTRVFNQLNRFPSGNSLWQRNYHEHIIRNETSYTKICEYIQTNPLRWKNDSYFVQ